MTGKSLNLGKFMTDQVANMFGHVWWLSVILTSDGQGHNVSEVTIETIRSCKAYLKEQKFVSEVKEKDFIS